jgi:hypothetical protein
MSQLDLFKLKGLIISKNFSFGREKGKPSGHPESFCKNHLKFFQRLKKEMRDSVVIII